MKWNRFTVKTKTEAEDIVISTLAEVGIEGVEIQDKQPLTEERQDSDVCRYYAGRIFRMTALPI